MLAIGAGILNFSPFLDAPEAKVMFTVDHCLFIIQLFHADVT